MRIDKLQLKNFRCFSHLVVDLHPKLTVLVANNGQGKSTLLDAIRIAVWPFIKSFDLSHSATFADPNNGIQIDDVSLLKLDSGTMARQLPCQISMTGDWGADLTRTWTRSRISEQAKTKTRDDEQTKFMAQWAETVQQQIRDPKKPSLDLPMLGYYGTGRLWAQKKLLEAKNPEQKDQSFFVRTFGYQNCMDPASSYKHFREWFIWAWQSWTNSLTRSSSTEAERTQAEIRIRMVQQAVDALLTEVTGWHTIEYSVEDEESLILSHPSYGRIKVDQMSDGIRSMIALTGDIAYRCIKLNPHLGNEALTRTQGIVLIDEVDMHLHPSWQQTVLGSLRSAFPAIQFVVTTHSPQVLSSIPKECIRVLGVNPLGDSIAEIPLAASYGAPSNDVLQAIMQVDPQPPVPEKESLERLTSMVEQGLHGSARAQQLLNELKQKLSPQHPQILKIERSIRRQEALNG